MTSLPPADRNYENKAVHVCSYSLYRPRKDGKLSWGVLLLNIVIKLILLLQYRFIIAVYALRHSLLLSSLSVFNCRKTCIETPKWRDMLWFSIQICSCICILSSLSWAFLGKFEPRCSYKIVLIKKSVKLNTSYNSESNKQRRIKNHEMPLMAPYNYI